MSAFFAIQRPDGTLIVDTADEDEDSAWAQACLREFDCYRIRDIAFLKDRGYRCVQVIVSEVGQEAPEPIGYWDGDLICRDFELTPSAHYRIPLYLDAPSTIRQEERERLADDLLKRGWITSAVAKAIRALEEGEG